MEQTRLRYGGRGKAGRSRLLDEICVLCGYERKYASKLLRGRRPIAGESGKCRGGSQRIYAAAEREVIKAIWLSAKQPCGKRLKAALPLWLPFYQKRHGQLESKVKAKVLGASAVFESGNQEPIFPEKKCFLRSCFETLAVVSVPAVLRASDAGVAHPLQPNLIFSEPNVSRDESGDGIGQVRFSGSAERRCASS